jgi:hypothetical protein
MQSNPLSFERRARAAATLVLLGTTLVAACDDDRAAESTAPLTPPTTASSIVRSSNTGALVWRTGATGNPFKFPGGAKFEIVGPQNAKWTLTDNVLPDTDPTAGKFQLTSLSPGSFTVCEVGAPVGHAIASPACQTAIVKQGAVVDVGAFVSAHLPYLMMSYLDYAKNPVGGGVFVVQDTLGNPIVAIPDNGMYDEDKSDGNFAVTLPGPGTYKLCKLIAPNGWLVPSWVNTCESKTLSNDMSLYTSALVVPPYSAVWSVVAGFLPPNSPLWLAGGTFTISKIDGSVVATVTDNDPTDRHKLDGIFYVKLPSAGDYVICQSGAIPNHYMPNPPCHTVTAEFGKVTWNDYYVNGEKQVPFP